MRFMPGASPLHAARASVAVAWCAALAGLALAFDHPLVLVAVIVASVAAGFLAGVARELRTAWRIGIFIAITWALINPFVAKQGLTVLLQFGGVPVLGQIDLTREALVYGLIQGVRVLALIIAVGVYAAAVDPDRVLRLFRRAGFRSALTATLATRLMPVLMSDGQRLADAQRCRARPAGRLTVMRAVAAGALDRAVDVAATLEVRGYGAVRRPPTAIVPWSRHDFAFLASALALGALALWAGLTGAFDWAAYDRTVIPLGVEPIGAAVAIVVLALAPFAERRGIAR